MNENDRTLAPHPSDVATVSLTALFDRPLQPAALETTSHRPPPDGPIIAAPEDSTEARQSGLVR